MDEEKYTRDSAKKSTGNKGKDEKSGTAEKKHGSKLKNEASANKSYRDKLRYGKKDNHISAGEEKQLRRMKKQGRRKIYRETAAADTIRKSVIRNEDDNSGTDSLNAGIAVTEAGFGKIREHGQSEKYAAKIHKRSDHLDAVQGARGAKEAGEAGESTMSATVKKAQKKLMQREFAEAAAKKQAKEAANGAGKISKKFTDKAEDLMGRLAEWVKEFFEDHPMALLFAFLILIVVLVISGVFTSCSAIGGGINSSTVVTSFTAEDDDIRQVEADYVALEADLQSTVDNIETDHPGYDEYNYSLAEISHNPFELAALLTVLYENYTPAQVQAKLQTIFDYQYTLTMTEVVETRTRTETRWHWVTHYREEERTGYRVVNGRLESYTYTVTVPYQVYESYEVGIGEVIRMIGDDHVPGKVIPLFHDIIFSHFCCHGKFQIRSFRRTAKRRDEFLFIRLIWIRDIGHSLFHCRFDWKDLNVSHIFFTISFSSSISCGVAVPTVFATLAIWLMFTPILCIS